LGETHALEGVRDVLVLLVHWRLIVRMVVAKERKTKTRSRGEEKRAVAVFSRWDNAGRASSSLCTVLSER
jgi:steroid 5-alpha reductase family enzyme